MKLAIRDFQSISKAVLEFNPGITVITGPNSSGKSAILRAINYGICLNHPVCKRFIKHGSSTSTVGLEIDNKKYIWSRSELGSTYKVNGASLLKVGRKTIHDFDSSFPLIFDEKGNILQIVTEWDKLFPFNRTDTELFSLFEDIFQISESTEINKCISDDVQNSNQSINKISEEILLKTNELNVLRSVDYDSLEDKNKKFYNLIHDKMSYYQGIEQDNSFVEDSLVKVERCKVELKTFPVEKFERFIEMSLSLTQLNKDLDFLSKSDFEVRNFDIGRMDKYLTISKDLDIINSDLEFIENTNFELKDYPLTILNKKDSLEEDLKFIETSEKYLSRISFKVVQFNIDHLKYQELQEVLEGIDQRLEELRFLENTVDILNVQGKELEDRIKEVKVCPLCGSKLI